MVLLITGLLITGLLITGLDWTGISTLIFMCHGMRFPWNSSSDFRVPVPTI